MEKLKITVIGCGWLGLPLCVSLNAVGHDVLTTTTTPTKYEQLALKFKVQMFDVCTQIPDQTLLSSDVIIYTIPPIAEGIVERFFHAVDPNQKIIFISSTSVYGKNQGPVDENSIFEPHSKNGLLLKEDEVYLRNHFKNLTVLRPGGLFNETRHPIFSLQGKSGLTTGQEFLHLVHLNDCIEAIYKIIEKNLWSQDFNLVNDLRIEKKDYYISIAQKFALTPPKYIDNPQKDSTIISNEKSKKMLSLVFKT